MFAAKDREPAMIRSELAWLRAILEDTRIIVPEPMANLRGNTVTSVSCGQDGDAFHCALTRWVEGRLYLRKNGPGPAALRQVGRTMAQLHLHGQRFRRPRGFRCRRWESESLFGAKSPYYPNAEKKLLDREDRRLFSRLIRRTREAMAQLGTDSDVFGLVHGDLIQLNYLFHHGKIRLIDFGDFGDAHYLYDMGVTLFALWGRDDQLRQRQAFLEGYRAVRPISADHEKLLDLFIAARGVVLARLVMGMMGEQVNETGMRYIAKVLEGIRLWMDAYGWREP
jgi:Ser/Thr protein kinase RdoA (MazF antagonist)